MKPTLRDIERIDIYAYIQGVMRKLTDERHYPYRNCLNCQHFTEGLEYCKHWQAKPPARVIAFGCNSHLDIEGIPF
jgi:hypothetical protein